MLRLKSAPRAVGIAFVVAAASMAMMEACNGETFVVARDAGASSDDGGGVEAGPPGEAGSLDGTVDDAGADVDASACRELASGGTSACAASGSCAKAAISGPVGANVRPPYVFAMTLDATFVYWVAQTNYNSPSSGGVYRVPKQGGATETLARGEDAPISIAVDGSWVYWMNEGTGQKTIRRLPKGAACAPTTCPTPEVVLAPSTDLDNDPVLSTLGEQDLFLTSWSGGYRYFRDPSSTSWISGARWQTGQRSSVTVGPRGIFTSAGQIDHIDTIKRDGSGAATLATFMVTAGESFPGATQLTSDCTHVYAYRDSAQEIVRASIDTGGGTASVVQPKLPGVYALAVDEKFIYIGVANGAGLFRAVKSVSNPTPITLAKGNVWAIATDDTNVFWADHVTGTVYSLTK